MISARVIRTKGGRILDNVPFDHAVVEGAIRDRDELYGVHVHAFHPKPGRDWWLITWPIELDTERAAEELHAFVLGMIPEGDIEMPKPFEGELEVLGDIFDQPVVFVEELRSIGERFVVAS